MAAGNSNKLKLANIKNVPELERDTFTLVTLERFRI